MTTRLEPFAVADDDPQGHPGQPRRRTVLAPVAGIPIVHDAAPAIEFGEAPPWAGSGVAGDAVRVRHTVGRPALGGLRRVFDASPSCSYFDSDAGVVVEFRGPAPGVPDQWLLTRTPGYDYELAYAHEPSMPMYQRAKDRTILSMALAQRGLGFIVHACGFLVRGAGILCPGLPSAGKSTIAGLLSGTSRPVTVLSDDRIALTDDVDGFRIWGTPWPGDAKVITAADGPLRVIVLLRHGASPALRPLSPRAGARRLLDTLVLPLWDRALLPRSLDFVDRLVQRIPILEFSYPPTVPAVEWMLDSLTREPIDG